MPSLPKPRLRRGARGDLIPAAAEPAERQPNVQTVTGEGLRWVNIERPSPLETAWLEPGSGKLRKPRSGSLTSTSAVTSWS